MRILLVGSGGREHAIAWKLSQSPLVRKIYAAPGNAGIYRYAELVNIRIEDLDSLARFAGEKEVDLTVVGPELPLALGIVDRFESEGLRIFGPSKSAAEIETSKAFAKQFMRRYHIPTASFMIFEDLREAMKFVKGSVMPLVIKADGLAAGKGVVLVENPDQAQATIRDMMQRRRFGEAGLKIVVEDVLVGEEVSVLALTDGKNVSPMLPAQDHKRIGDGDTGPNTGGMGAYAPVRFISEAMLKDIRDLILEPVINGLRSEGRPFRGVLYAGLMITDKGPRVLEFNCRFGDPETQAILPLLKSDLAQLFQAVVTGELDLETIAWHDLSAVCVILASGGYPGDIETGKVIYGLKDIRETEVQVFHSGTSFSERRFLTAGGRVLGITATDEHIENAITKAYEAAERIRFEGKQFRSDIGLKATKKVQFYG